MYLPFVSGGEVHFLLAIRKIVCYTGRSLNIENRKGVI